MSADAARSDLLDLVQAGACLGVAAGYFWAFLVFVGPLLDHSPAWLERVGPPVAVGLLLATWIGGGARFGWLLRRRLGVGGRGGAILGGVVAPVMMVLGLALALRVEHFALEERGVAAELLPYVFTAAFAPHAAGLVFALTLTVGLASRSGRSWRGALGAAALAGFAFVALSLLLNQLPGWRVGNGERAMVKVALVANTLAAAVGGAAAMTLLGPGTRCSAPVSRPKGTRAVGAPQT
jgi:hypothetical protein